MYYILLTFLLLVAGVLCLCLGVKFDKTFLGVFGGIFMVVWLAMILPLAVITSRYSISHYNSTKWKIECINKGNYPYDQEVLTSVLNDADMENYLIEKNKLYKKKKFLNAFYNKDYDGLEPLKINFVTPNVENKRTF